MACQIPREELRCFAGCQALFVAEEDGEGLQDNPLDSSLPFRVRTKQSQAQGSFGQHRLLDEALLP
jgi:hypothetical protein